MNNKPFTQENVYMTTLAENDLVQPLVAELEISERLWQVLDTTLSKGDL